MLVAGPGLRSVENLISHQVSPKADSDARRDELPALNVGSAQR